MLESLLAIVQVLLSTTDFASIAISASTPIGLATGIHAKQNGLDFFPWFLAGTIAPGLSIYPMRKRINKLIEKKSEDRIDYLLKFDPSLAISPKTGEMTKEAQVVRNIWNKTLSTFDANGTRFLPEKEPEFIDSSSITSAEEGDQNILFGEQLNQTEALELKWIDDKLKYLDTKIVFNDADNKSTKGDSINLQNVKLDQFLTFLDGVWIHIEKDKTKIKKAIFESDKFELITKSGVGNISKQYADFVFEGHICQIKLSEHLIRARVLSADEIYLNGERFIRYKK